MSVGENCRGQNMTESSSHSIENEVKLLIAFSLPNVLVEKIRNVSPRVKVYQSDDEKELLMLIKDTEILLAHDLSREMFLAAKKLKWIQTKYVGVDELLCPEVVDSDVIITNASGVNSVAVAEHVIGLMLCLNRKLHYFINNQKEKRWKTNDTNLPFQLEELAGKTLGIVGIGKIGGEIARKAKCLGMKVLATRRDLYAPTPEYVDRLVPIERLKELLAQSDFVVIQLPLTRETEGLIGEDELRSMKSTGYLINASRGKVVREDKLIQALKEGWIDGAGLDTFVVEPLPESSPLWDIKNVIITPHIAGSARLTPQYLDRLVEIFCENLRRFLSNRNLINVVDKHHGY
jgi:D-2-hydroxyacid dehydrogenase (NADP+)